MKYPELVLCLRPCCLQHPDRRCRLLAGHDGDHDDTAGHQWVNFDRRRAMTAQSSDPVGTVRRHYNMIAVKHTASEWLIVYPDPDEPPLLTPQRIEDIADKWPLVRKPAA